MTARVLADGSLQYLGEIGSIHQIAKKIRKGPVNGWDTWFYLDSDTNQLKPIDELRKLIRSSSQTKR